MNLRHLFISFIILGFSYGCKSSSDTPFDFSQTPKVFTQFRKELEKKSKVRHILKIQAQNELSKLERVPEIPSLKDLGFEDFEIDNRTVFPFKGGEKSAGQRLEHYFFESKALGVYKKTRNGLLGLNYSSKFSPWLANGMVFRYLYRCHRMGPIA